MGKTKRKKSVLVKELSRRITNKTIVCGGLFLFLTVVIISFMAYLYADYREETRYMAIQKAQNQANRIVQQNDERLENLKQYYLTNVQG